MPPTPRVSIYKRGESRYSVRWRENGTQHEERGYATETAAEDRAHEIRGRLRHGVPRVRQIRLVGELAARWWDEYATERVEASTRVAYKTAMRRILETIGEWDALTITKPDIIQWHQNLDMSNRAANITLTALSSIFQRHVEWGVLETNPCHGVKKFREQRQPAEIPTSTDVIRLALTAPSERERGMLLIACYCGLRQGELLALHVGDLQHGRLRVNAALGPNRSRKATKTHSGRMVPVPKPVYEWLEAYTTGRPSTEPLFPHNKQGDYIERSQWRRSVYVPWAEKAGVSVLWRHLRHYYASSLASVGVSVLACSRWMGHSTISTTMDKYGFLFDEDENRAMEALTRR